MSRRCCGRLCVCPGVRVFLCGAVDEPLLCWGRPARRAAAEDRKGKGNSSRRVFRVGKREGTLLGRLYDQCLAAPCLAVAHAPAAWELCRGRACLTHVIAVFRISLFFLRMDFVTRQTGSVLELSVRCLQPLCWLSRGRVLVLLRSVSQVSSRGMNFTKAFIIKIFLMYFFTFFLFFQGGCVPSGRRGADCLMAESLPLIDNVNSAEGLAVTWRHQGRQTDANYSLSRRNI